MCYVYIIFYIFFYIYIYLYILNIFSGDKQQALNHIQMLLESRSKFLSEFIIEGLRFRSSLYKTMIWLRIFRWVLHDPKTIKEKMNPQLEGFKNFFDDPTADNYMNCVFKEISNTYSQPDPSRSNTKRCLLQNNDKRGCYSRFCLIFEEPPY